MKIGAGLGYTQNTTVLLTLTQYICNLGYRVFAPMNDSALAIPLTLQTGLDEVGRQRFFTLVQRVWRTLAGTLLGKLMLLIDAWFDKRNRLSPRHW